MGTGKNGRHKNPKRLVAQVTELDDAVEDGENFQSN
jgi:hypothetical protein